MPPKGNLPSCGFSVSGTKKGELPLKVEKRARGKKVTIVPNVSGDATKLVRSLQALLGTGGTVRHAEGGGWTVEVQGDQTARVTRALLDFNCLNGISKSALETLRNAHEGTSQKESVIARTAATKYLENTQKLSASDERRKALECEAEFYSQFWQNAVPCDDFSDIWEDTINSDFLGAKSSENRATPATTVAELNTQLMTLGMLAESGRAVKEFWAGTQLTLTQFRKMALNPGARLIGEGRDLRTRPTNLISRQKMSDYKSGGGRARTNYFSYTCSVIDDYQKGIVRTREERDAMTSTYEPVVEEEPKFEVHTDSEGWCSAVFSYVVPLRVPPSRLEEEEVSSLAKRALKSLETSITGDLSVVGENVPGVNCVLDCETFGVNLELSENVFLHAPKNIGGKAPDKQMKEELKLEKKLRDICALRRRQQEGEKLDKLQTEKARTKEDLFREVAELKLRRAEKDLKRVFKQHGQRFRDTFYDFEDKAKYGDDAEDVDVNAPAADTARFGAFDPSTADGDVRFSTDGTRAQSDSSEWAGVRINLEVRSGEVGAFAVEVLGGLLRLGWAAPGTSVSDLGCERGSFGFGGTGRKVTGGVFEAYGTTFKAGDVIHCEAEREEGVLRIGFAKNDNPLGVAYDIPDSLDANVGLSGVVCGKGFQARLVSAESMPIDEAPVLEAFREFDPPRLASVLRNIDVSDDGLTIRLGEVLHISCDDGEGWVFGFFLDPEDPDDGGWVPADAVRFLDEEVEQTRHDDGENSWTVVTSPTDLQSTNSWSAPTAVADADDDTWGSAPLAETVVSESVNSHADVGGGYASRTTATAHAPAACPPARSDVVSAVAADESLTCEVDGLEDWLRGMNLQKYESKAIDWCIEMGAVSLTEVKECWEDFADALTLKPLERKRLAKGVAA
eukprot:TRINITY_DN34688_c0_g2_i1.p1 TRINITY_DN34688_c0_g2~~TRINITY_DN34688_c0_g2_i1.p1  ORF type:complete len:934 (-),score=164.30 TRINITY_DN34688_c0_g2_i1:132-2846(-)